MAIMAEDELTTSPDIENDDKQASLSRGRLIWRRFKRHRMALIALYVLIFLYLVAIFADFVAPYNADSRFRGLQNAPPSPIHFTDENGQLVSPYVYGREKSRDPVTAHPIFTEVTEQKYPIRLFVRGDTYRLFGV